MPTVEAVRETDATLTMGSKNGSSSEAPSNRGPERQREGPGDNRYQVNPNEEEGVEVVLSDRGMSRVVDGHPKSRSGPNQNVFRHPHAVRPRAMRAPNGHGGPPPPHPHLHGSGSWGYGPPQHGDYGPPPPPPPPRPYPVPYNPSGSFDEQGSHHHHNSHYSPHVQYQQQGARYAPEDINVISPNHKGDPHYRPALAPRPRHLPPQHSQHYYQYPPTSPVSRPGGPQPSAPPRLRNYAMRRGGDGPYSKAQRGGGGDYYQRPEDGGGWNPYPARSPSSREAEQRQPQPPLVAESSFDSEHHSRSSHSHASHPPTPGAPPPPPPPPPRDPRDPHYQQFYGGGPGGPGGSFGSFDSAAGPPPHFDDQRYYGFPPPDSPYSSAYAAAPFSPGGIYPSESFPPPPNYGPPQAYSYSYDEQDDQHNMLKDYHPDRDGDMNKQMVTPPNRKSRGGGSTPVASNTSNMLLPKAADEIDFDVTDPPAEPVCPPSTESMCDSLGDVNTYDVLCGRGGGTNSQVGNRRFRKLVQDFQPTYLLARRKEKPLLARTIVLIIRKRGGRFLKKDDDSGEMFEVGDIKAEAKTSQALREGLDVRATKSAASSLMDKKKKKNGKKGTDEDDDDDSLDSPGGQSSRKEGHLEDESLDSPRPTESPPTLPRLQGDEVKSGMTHPHSPDDSQFRKRRRMRPTGYVSDKFFPDFCPPRADIGRASPLPHHMPQHMGMAARSPMARSPMGSGDMNRDDDSIRYDNESVPAAGCGGIALDMVTGAATGSFCLGPTGWRR
jgi:hypothetical protein